MNDFSILSARKKFLLSEDAAGDFERILPPGVLAGLYIVIRGTNNSGQTLTHADLPEITINDGGRTDQRWTGALLKQYNNQKFGAVESTSTAAGAIGLAMFVPFFLPGLKSAKHIRSGDKVSLLYRAPSTYATKVANATVRVYGILSNEPEKYTLRSLPANITAAGATTKTEVLPQLNINQILLTSTVVDRVVYRREGKEISVANYADLISATAMFSRIETVADVTHLSIVAGENPTDFVAETTELELDFSGAGTATIQTISVAFNGERFNETVAQRASEVQKRIEQVAPKDALPVLLAETRKTAE